MSHRKSPFGAHIDWYGWIRAERVRRLLAVPLFLEAGSLFRSAALLWQGRLGKGRIRGGELNALGVALVDRAQSWNRIVLGWSDSPLSPAAPGEPVGPLLSRYRSSRSFGAHDRNFAGKDPMAARRLTNAAAALVMGDLNAIRLSGDHLYSDKEADAWEDALERLEDSPCFVPPSKELAPSQISVLGSRAFYRTCGDLAHTMAITLGNSTHEPSDPPRELKRELDRWYTYALGFASDGRRCYESFLHDAPNFERKALHAVMDDANHYSHGLIDRNFADRTQLERAGAVVSALIQILLTFGGLESSTWDGGDLGPETRLPTRTEFVARLAAERPT